MAVERDMFHTGTGMSSTQLLESLAASLSRAKGSSALEDVLQMKDVLSSEMLEPRRRWLCTPPAALHPRLMSHSSPLSLLSLPLRFLPIPSLHFLLS